MELPSDECRADPIKILHVRSENLWLDKELHVHQYGFSHAYHIMHTADEVQCHFRLCAMYMYMYVIDHLFLTKLV